MWRCRVHLRRSSLFLHWRHLYFSPDRPPRHICALSARSLMWLVRLQQADGSPWNAAGRLCAVYAHVSTHHTAITWRAEGAWRSARCHTDSNVWQREREVLVLKQTYYLSSCRSPGVYLKKKKKYTSSRWKTVRVFTIQASCANRLWNLKIKGFNTF